MTSLSIQSNSGISKSEQADDMCPATPTPTSPSKKYHISPNKSPSKATSKHGKELQVLTELVQGLSRKLKKRDKQMRQMQEKAGKLNEVALRLESTNKSIADAATENQTLSRRLLNVEAGIKAKYVEESDRSKRIDEVEFRQVGQQTTTNLENQGGTKTSRTVVHTQEHIHTVNQRAKVLEAASVIQAVTGLHSERRKSLNVSEADSVIQDVASLSEQSSSEKLIDEVLEAASVIQAVTGLHSERRKSLNVSEADSAIQDVASLSEQSSNEKLIDEEDFRQLKIQRTFAVFKAEEKEVALAESQTESEELRSQLVALMALLQHQNCGSPSVSESPRSIASPVNSMKLLSEFWKSPKKAPKLPIP